MRKGDKTRESILDASGRLFAASGYANVTMKDICEAADLSRGGLYRHFSSVKDIFIEILNRDIEINRFTVDEVISRNIPADKIFRHFLQLEKGSMFGPERGFFFAVHEFAFIEDDQKSFFDDRIKDAAAILEKIFTYGQKTGAFREFNVQAVSRHILYTLDAMKTSSSVLSFDEKHIDDQFNIIWELIL